MDVCMRVCMDSGMGMGMGTDMVTCMFIRMCLMSCQFGGRLRQQPLPLCDRLLDHRVGTATRLI